MPSLDDLCGNCGKDKLVVTADGRTYPCLMARAHDVGSAMDGIAPVLQSDELRQFRHRMESVLVEREREFEQTRARAATTSELASNATIEAGSENRLSRSCIPYGPDVTVQNPAQVAEQSVAIASVAPWSPIDTGAGDRFFKSCIPCIPDLRY